MLLGVERGGGREKEREREERGGGGGGEGDRREREGEEGERRERGEGVSHILYHGSISLQRKPKNVLFKHFCSYPTVVHISFN